jgi:hypothetical protein
MQAASHAQKRKIVRLIDPPPIRLCLFGFFSVYFILFYGLASSTHTSTDDARHGTAH